MASTPCWCGGHHGARERSAFLLFFVSHLVNELPGLALAALAAGTLLALIGGDSASTGGVVALGLAGLTALGLLELIRRGLMTSPVVERSLDQEIGPGWRSLVRPADQSPPASVRSASCSPPLPPPSTRAADQGTSPMVTRDAATGSMSYCRRGATRGGPVLVHFHGGPLSARRARAARHAPLLHRLASQGWVCISANYRLGAAGTFPGLAHRRQASDQLGAGNTPPSTAPTPLDAHRGWKLGRRPSGGDGRADPR